MPSSLLYPVHLLCVGLWAGCVATEVWFERRLAAACLRGELAGLHRRVDLWVELPAVLLVAGSGLALWSGRPVSGLPALKLWLGLLAVLANLWCIKVVVLRDRAWQAGRLAEHDRLDRQQHRLGTVVVLGLAGALVAGLLHRAQG